MKVGIVVPLYEGEPNGVTPRFGDLQAMARKAETLGLDSIWVRDHLLYRGEEHGEAGCWEAFTMLSALAASTSRITLGTLVAATAYRNPALLAKMADSLDEISDGRFVLGLGCGWHRPEFDAFGYSFDRRVDRFEEAMEIIAPLLRGDRVTFHGHHYQVNDAVLRPRGPSDGGPAIWIGAKQPRMLRLAAAYGDAWNADWIQSPSRLDVLHRQMIEACSDVGRESSTLPITAQADVRIVQQGEARARDAAIVGSVAEIVSVFQGLANAGVEHLIVDVRPGGLVGVERLAEVREFAQGQVSDDARANTAQDEMGASDWTSGRARWPNGIR